MVGGSWWQDDCESRVHTRWWHSLVGSLISRGGVPRHVGFVMDGNRRFARSRLLASALDGHELGFRQLTTILRWCRDLGVSEVTVYAFSIENFKRSRDEVDGLMRLAEEKFQQLLDEKDKLHSNEICFRFFGDLTRLPASLQRLTAQVELETKQYTRGFVNVCIAYTAQDEMQRAIATIAKGVQLGLIDEGDIDERLIERCLDTRHSPAPDLLIRTSGEKRFSDFLLWQCSSCHVHYEDVLWPEFDYWHLCKAMIAYQYYRKEIEKLQGELPVICDEKKGDGEGTRRFLEWLETRHVDCLHARLKTEERE